MREVWELASFVVTAPGLPFWHRLLWSEDSHNALPLLLQGEDPEFQQYLRRVAHEERGTPLATF